jgi:hypothetical protein
MAVQRKYASAFYGRCDADNRLTLERATKRSTNGPGSSDEALREVAMDAERRGHVMVKPRYALSGRGTPGEGQFKVPTFAYKSVANTPCSRRRLKTRWLDRGDAGNLLAFKRAGADGVLTYFAQDAARLLNAKHGGSRLIGAGYRPIYCKTLCFLVRIFHHQRPSGRRNTSGCAAMSVVRVPGELCLDMRQTRIPKRSQPGQIQASLAVLGQHPVGRISDLLNKRGCHRAMTTHHSMT